MSPKPKRIPAPYRWRRRSRATRLSGPAHVDQLGGGPRCRPPPIVSSRPRIPATSDQPPRFLGPFVDAVARVKATVHHKLLAGFLVIALLLLSMGVVCVVVLERIDSQVVRLTLLSNQVNQAREMIYEVTAQSHYRAMALLTDPTDPYWTDKIYAAKAEFDTEPVGDPHLRDRIAARGLRQDRLGQRGLPDRQRRRDEAVRCRAHPTRDPRAHRQGAHAVARARGRAQRSDRNLTGRLPRRDGLVRDGTAASSRAWWPRSRG